MVAWPQPPDHLNISWLGKVGTTVWLFHGYSRLDFLDLRICPCSMPTYFRVNLCLISKRKSDRCVLKKLFDRKVWRLYIRSLLAGAYLTISNFCTRVWCRMLNATGIPATLSFCLPLSFAIGLVLCSHIQWKSLAVQAWSFWLQWCYYGKNQMEQVLPPPLLYLLLCSAMLGLVLH